MAMTAFTAEDIAGAGKEIIFQFVQNKFSVFKCLAPTCKGSAYFTLETIPDGGFGYPPVCRSLSLIVTRSPKLKD